MCEEGPALFACGHGSKYLDLKQCGKCAGKVRVSIQNVERPGLMKLISTRQNAALAKISKRLNLYNDYTNAVATASTMLN